jgi:hypothetical protein
MTWSLLYFIIVNSRSSPIDCTNAMFSTSSLISCIWHREDPGNIGINAHATNTSASPYPSSLVPYGMAIRFKVYTEALAFGICFTAYHCDRPSNLV